MEESWEITRGHFWRLLAFWVGLGLLGTLLLFGHLGALGALQFSALMGAGDEDSFGFLAVCLGLFQLFYVVSVLAPLAILKQLEPAPREEVAEPILDPGLSPDRQS